MNSKLKKRLRTIGHDLKPVVTIAEKGLSASVVAELNRALDDHELIKVRIAGGREERSAVATELKTMADTEVVQTIGGIVLIYRPAKEPNPHLSNLLRAKVL
jgi:RNA-binding protein